MDRYAVGSAATDRTTAVIARACLVDSLRIVHFGIEESDPRVVSPSQSWPLSPVDKKSSNATHPPNGVPLQPVSDVRLCTDHLPPPKWASKGGPIRSRREHREIRCLQKAESTFKCVWILRLPRNKSTRAGNIISFCTTNTLDVWHRTAHCLMGESSHE